MKHESWFGSFLIKFAAFRVIEKEKNKENKESRVQRENPGAESLAAVTKNRQCLFR